MHISKHDYKVLHKMCKLENQLHILLESNIVIYTMCVNVTTSRKFLHKLWVENFLILVESNYFKTDCELAWWKQSRSSSKIMMACKIMKSWILDPNQPTSERAGTHILKAKKLADSAFKFKTIGGKRCVNHGQQNLVQNCITQEFFRAYIWQNTM